METFPQRVVKVATLKEVAVRAGVSLGTASRVLSGGAHTSTESRSRVRAAAAELHYVSNGPARSLRRVRTDTLGLLLSDIRNPFFSSLAHAAEQEARRRGYAVLLANANEDGEQENAYLHTFAAQRIDGLLLAPQGGLGTQLVALQRSGLPLVLVDRSIPGADIPLISSDNTGGVGQVMSWLQRRGHRKVAFIGGPAGTSTGSERRNAYLAGLTRHGFDPDDALLEHGDYDAESGARAMARILDRGASPTAVFSTDGLLTTGAFRVLRERLGAAAQDIDIVSFDDLDWFEFVEPSINAVRNDASAIGKLGVSSLIDLIEGRSAESRRVPTTFIERPREAK